MKLFHADLAYPLRRIGIICVITILLAITGCTVYPVNEDNLNHWNLDLPQFSNVKLAIEHNNLELAAKTIVDYYRKREAPQWPFTTQQVLREVKSSPREIIAKADRLLRGEFRFINTPRILGKRIPWTHNPTNNQEWLWELNRHYWFLTLARAYVLTKDERYSRFFVTHLTDWINRNPPPKTKDETSATWRLLECGLRLSESWIASYGLFKDSPQFTWESQWKMLNSIHDQAQFLAQFHTARNHLLMESNGLASAAAYFPEFRLSSTWKERAFTRLEREYRSQIYPDGVHYECSTHYQRTCVEVFEETLRLAALAGISKFQHFAKQNLVKMYRFMAFAMTPDGTLPLINDGEMQIVRPMILTKAREWQAPAIRYIASNGLEGKSPRRGIFSYPYGGFTIYRSGYSPDDWYIFFDHGPLGGDHGHEDFLNIVFYADGNSLLVDPGTYTYDFNDPARYYFISSAAHNLVQINGYSQARRYNRQDPARIKPQKMKASAVSNQFAALMQATFLGPYGTEEEVVYPKIEHTRQLITVQRKYLIIADYLKGIDDAVYDLSLHLSPEARQVSLNEHTGQVTATFSRARMAIIPLWPLGNGKAKVVKGEKEPFDGWYSPGYNLITPAPVVHYSLKGKRNMAFYTIIFPSTRQKEKKLDVKWASLRTHNRVIPAAKGIAVEVSSYRFTDYLLISHMVEGEKNAFGVKSDGFVSIFRKTRHGTRKLRFKWPGASPSQKQLKRSKRVSRESRMKPNILLRKQ